MLLERVRVCAGMSTCPTTSRRIDGRMEDGEMKPDTSSSEESDIVAPAPAYRCSTARVLGVCVCVLRGSADAPHTLLYRSPPCRVVRSGSSSWPFPVFECNVTYY